MITLQDKTSFKKVKKKHKNPTQSKVWVLCHIVKKKANKYMRLYKFSFLFSIIICKEIVSSKNLLFEYISYSGF